MEAVNFYVGSRLATAAWLNGRRIWPVDTDGTVRLNAGADQLMLGGQSLSLSTDAMSIVGASSLDITSLPLGVQIVDSQDATLQALASDLHLSGMACAVQIGTVINAQSSVGAGHLSMVAQSPRASTGVVAQAVADALAAIGQQVAVQTGSTISLGASVHAGALTLSGQAAIVTATTHIDAVANIGADAVQYGSVAARVGAGASLGIGVSAHGVISKALSITTSSHADVASSVGAVVLLTTAKALGATVTGVDGTATMTTQPTATVTDTTARIAFRVSGRSA